MNAAAFYQFAAEAAESAACIAISIITFCGVFYALLLHITKAERGRANK